MCHNLVAGERYNKSTRHPAYEEMLGQAKWGVQEFTPPVGMWDFTYCRKTQNNLAKDESNS